VLRKYLLLLIFFMPLLSYSQYWEVGVFMGASNYRGDLVDGIINLKETKPAAGAIIRYNLSPFLTLKSNFYYGKIAGDDKYSKIADHEIRNLNFTSTLLDIGFQTEINLTGYKSGHSIYKSSPYIFFGLSVFRFNPQAEYMDTIYNLQSLCTEGQGTTKYNDREKYGLTQIAIPLGFGLKKTLGRFWNVGVEVGVRATFTDYLDDVSTTYVESDVLVAAYGVHSAALSNRSVDPGTGQSYNYTSQDDRGDPTTRDMYMFAGVTLTYSILPNRCYKF
jgi:hypothetical protein